LFILNNITEKDIRLYKKTVTTQRKINCTESILKANIFPPFVKGGQGDSMLIAQNMESPQPPFSKGEKTIGIIIAKYTV